MGPGMPARKNRVERLACRILDVGKYQKRACML